MKAVVVGCGYVGVALAATLSRHGHVVHAVERDNHRLAMLRAGQSPIFEAGTAAALQRGLQHRTIRFTHELMAAVTAVGERPTIFVCVPTPLGPDGILDITSLHAVLESLPDKLEDAVLVIKSTVPPGTCLELQRWCDDRFGRGAIEVVMNPEFLRQGTALSDMESPDRTVIGSQSQAAAMRVDAYYKGIPGPRVFTDLTSAELIKLVSNAFLATKISFANEIAGLCEALGATALEVLTAVGLDHRIGTSHLGAGLGYGGSCLPKDLATLVTSGANAGRETLLLAAAQRVNENRVPALLERLLQVTGNLSGKQLTVLGLAFKAGTGDLRDAPALTLLSALREHGANVRCYDPVVSPEAALAQQADAYEDPYAAVTGSSAIIIATEWPVFAQLDWARIRQLMVSPVVSDSRNCLDEDTMRSLGFIYIPVGGAIVNAHLTTAVHE